MSEIKISTIIPVYNAEKYIERCLRSVLNQIMESQEIICVNDGSTDSSLAILESFAKENEKIRVLNQKHQYAGTARNYGMSVARGEYIHFLDVDDVLFPDVYSILYKSAKKIGVDCLKFGGEAFSFREGEKVDASYDYSLSYLDRNTFDKVISINTNPKELIDYSSRVPWLALYKRNFLERNHIRFNDLKCVNDRSFYVQVIISTNRIAYIDLCAVKHQVGNPNSLVGIRCDNFLYHFESYNEVESLLINCDPVLKKRILTAELFDLFGWYSQMNDKQIKKIEWNTYRFFLSLNWSNLNRDPFVFENMTKINALLSEYGKAKEIEPNEFVKISRNKGKIWLYGAGQMGRIVSKFLKTQGIEIEGVLISDNSEYVEIEEITTERIGGFTYDHNDAVILISAKSIYHIQMIHEIRKKGIDHIYYFSDEALEKLKLSYQNKEYSLGRVSDWDIIRKRTPRKELIVVADIAEHCNLNCQNCDHFSPLSKECFMEYEDFEKDIARISSIMGDRLSTLKIEGGEPLLHPNIIKFLRCSRQYLKNVTINIITNGLLLLEQSAEFWKACQECQIGICVTKYPIDFEYDRVKKICDDYNIDFQYYNFGEPIKTSKYKPMDISGSQNKYDSFHHCLRANGECADLKHGRLYPCTFAANVHIFNEYFDQSIQITSKDYLDIYSNIDAQDVFDFMCNPIPACSYCKSMEWKGGYEWKTSNREISEWI